MSKAPAIRIVLAISVCVAIAAWLWVRHHRLREYASFQLVAVGQALAAYVQDHGGVFPHSAKCLVRDKLIREVASDEYEVAPRPVPGYPWSNMYPRRVRIAMRDVCVGWDGIANCEGGLLIGSRRFSTSLRGLAENISSWLSERMMSLPKGKRGQGDITD
jgi:hypothetical protein